MALLISLLLLLHELFDHLDTDQVRRVENQLVIVAKHHAGLYLLATLFPQSAHLAEFQDLYLRVVLVLMLVLEPIDHSLEVWVVRLQEHLLVDQIQRFVVVVTSPNLINLPQFVLSAGLFCVFYALLSFLVLYLVGVREHLLGKSGQTVVVVEELHFVVDGQLELADVLLAPPFNWSHKVRFILQFLLLAVEG